MRSIQILWRIIQFIFVHVVDVHVVCGDWFTAKTTNVRTWSVVHEEYFSMVHQYLESGSTDGSHGRTTSSRTFVTLHDRASSLPLLVPRVEGSSLGSNSPCAYSG